MDGKAKVEDVIRVEGDAEVEVEEDVEAEAVEGEEVVVEGDGWADEVEAEKEHSLFGIEKAIGFKHTIGLEIDLTLSTVEFLNLK